MVAACVRTACARVRGSPTSAASNRHQSESLSAESKSAEATSLRTSDLISSMSSLVIAPQYRSEKVCARDRIVAKGVILSRFDWCVATIRCRSNGPEGAGAYQEILEIAPGQHRTSPEIAPLQSLRD